MAHTYMLSFLTLTMIDIEKLRICTDCGTVYYEEFSRGVCPNCHTNNFEKIADSSNPKFDK